MRLRAVTLSGRFSKTSATRVTVGRGAAVCVLVNEAFPTVDWDKAYVNFTAAGASEVKK